MKTDPSKLNKIPTTAVTLACVALAAGSGHATTLTFDGGHTSNVAVNADYGSNVASNSTTFVTTDGSGATPNIALTWPGLAPGTGNGITEFHDNALWDVVEDVTVTGLGNTHIVQLQSSLGNTNPITITFTPDPGFGVVFNSVDLGNGNGASANSWTVSIQRDLDSSTVFTTGSIPFAGNSAQTIDFGGFNGNVGESYTLLLAEGTNSNFGALDDLSFSQVAIPEPSALLLTMIGSVAFLRRRR